MGNDGPQTYLECRIILDTIKAVRVDGTGGDLVEMYDLYKKVSSIEKSEPVKAAGLIVDSAVGRKHVGSKLRELADLLVSHE